MSKKLQLFCLALLGSVLLNAQSKSLMLPEDQSGKSKISGTEVPDQQWNDWFNKEVEKFEKNMQAGKTTAVDYRIPVIFHIIHFGQAVGTFPNIDSNQVKSQIAVLNADYAGTGLNVSNVPTPFAGLVSNTGIQFCLARRDPTNLVLGERGIHRVNANGFGWANPSATLNIVSYINNVVKPLTVWDPAKYLNIWVSDKNPNVPIVGFSTFPAGTTLNGIPTSGGTSGDDGVWLWGRTVGNQGSVIAPYNQGRVATREIAHWLGVRSIWGDGNCLDDYCSDTPWHKQPNSGCPAWPAYTNRCGLGQSPDGEMTMNFMDETDDVCRYMFTPRQVTRMQTAMSQGTYRNQLGTHNLCSSFTAVAAPAVANFHVNEIPCVGTPFTPINNSTGWPSPTFQWSSSPAAGIYPAASVAYPAITFNAPGTYTLYMTATNTTNISSYSLVVSNVTTCPAPMQCLDTLRMIKSTDTLITYKSANNPLVQGCQTGFAGYLTGTNCYHDKEFAQFYTSSTYSQITLPQVNSVIVLFDSIGTKATPFTMGTQISCILYSGTAGFGPNSQLAVKTDSLRKIAMSTKTVNIKFAGDPGFVFTNTKVIPFKFNFAAPVVLTPNAPGFFAAIQTPFTSPTDSIRIFSNKLNNNAVDSSAWVLLNPSNNWRTMKNAKNAKIHLAIFPQVTCRPIVGVNELKTEFNSNISVMPNPSNGQFNLIFTLPKEQDLNVKVYNAMGQHVSSERLENVSNSLIKLDIADKADGIYFLEISNGTEKVVKKIVVSH